MSWWDKFFKRKKSKDTISEKDQATARGESYVKVLNVNVDFDNPADGYFELEWNQHFIRELMDAGYTGSNEEEIVDAWFTNLCRNIADEV